MFLVETVDSKFDIVRSIAEWERWGRRRHKRRRRRTGERNRGLRKERVGLGGKGVVRG